MVILPHDFEQDCYGLHMRLVRETDAEFIVRLRSEPNLSKYLHPIVPSIEKQKEWILQYKLREIGGLEYYFIFYSKGLPIGLERIYDIKDDSYTHGSLIFDYNAPLGSSIVADISTREIGFNILCKQFNFFDVRKKNKSVIDYHKRFGPVLIREDADNYYYVLEKMKFVDGKRFYKNFLKLKF